MTEQETALFLLSCTNYWANLMRGKDPDEMTKAWATALKDVPLQAAKSGAANLAATLKFPPTVAELRTAAEPSAGSTDRTELSDASSEEAKTLVVHICGAVSAPGVYELPAGSRIIDAVEAGGGFLPEADEACCNLAEEIVDGCQIYIMTKSESCADGQTEKKAGIQTSPDSDMQTTDRNVRSNSAPALENGLVNLNTADVAALMTLPGIGESRAKAIISYREQHGAFAKIEDIMKISGIKQAAFSKIKDKITV